MKEKFNVKTEVLRFYLELTPQGMAFLAGTTHGTSNYDIYAQMVSAMTTTTPNWIYKRGIPVVLNQGQVDASANLWSDILGIGRKAISRALRDMDAAGLIKLHPSKICSVADMISVAGWNDVDGTYVQNPWYVDKKKTTEQQITIESAMILPSSKEEDTVEDLAQKIALTDNEPVVSSEKIHGNDVDIKTTSVAPKKPQTTLFQKAHNKNFPNGKKPKHSR